MQLAADYAKRQCAIGAARSGCAVDAGGNIKIHDAELIALAGVHRLGVDAGRRYGGVDVPVVGACFARVADREETAQLGDDVGVPSAEELVCAEVGIFVHVAAVLGVDKFPALGGGIDAEFPSLCLVGAGILGAEGGVAARAARVGVGEVTALRVHNGVFLAFLNGGVFHGTRNGHKFEDKLVIVEFFSRALADARRRGFPELIAS